MNGLGFLEVGDVIVLKKGQRVYSKEHLLDVVVGITPGFLPGEYVVVNTRLEGGATGVGMTGHDDWPDGHRVYLQKISGDFVEKSSPIVSFYQSGCFTIIYKNIQPTRHLKRITIWS